LSTQSPRGKDDSNRTRKRLKEQTSPKAPISAQRSLKAFFQSTQTKQTPEATVFDNNEYSHKTFSAIPNEKDGKSPTQSAGQDSVGNTNNTSSSDLHHDEVSIDDELSLAAINERIAETDDSKVEWTKLFSKRNVPRCEDHKEPCIILETKKKGFNCGRKFYICSRPLGPTGAKERGTKWRCRTFIWASDVSKASAV